MSTHYCFSTLHTRVASVIVALILVMFSPALLIAQAEAIVFASKRTGNSDLFLMSVDGSDVTRLTFNIEDDIHPDWSPDGKRIAFSSDRRDGKQEIYVMNADGSGQIRLTNSSTSDLSPNWSPDGTKIAFSRQKLIYVPPYSYRFVPYIYVMNADGSELKGITNISPSLETSTASPTWSPDGTKIACDIDNQIFVMNASDGTEAHSLTYAGINFDPDWSSDGKQIIFTSRRAGMNNEIYVMNVDGTGQTPLTNHMASDFGASWSPDGTKIVFTSDRDGNDEIYVMNADGAGQTRLTKDPASDFTPDWGQITTSIHIRENIPEHFILIQNYPNPFNPTTLIEYSIPKPSYIELKIYDIVGQEVQTLVKTHQDGDSYRVHFDGKGLHSGVYFYSLRTGESVETKKMLLVK